MRIPIAVAITIAYAQALEHEQNVMTIYGKRTEFGSKHHMLKSSNAEVVVYPDEGAFSTRLTPNLKQSVNGPHIKFNASADVAVTFNNYSNMYYTAPVFFGPSRVQFDLLFDTGSPELTLGVSTCTGCMGNTYDVTAGTTAGTFTWTGVTRNVSYYDGTSYDGERCKETTCVLNDASTCMTNFQFLCIKNSNDDSTLDGILGLGRKGTLYEGECYVD
jgi:hypothetical protein